MPTYLQNPDIPGETMRHVNGNVGVLLIHGFTATTAEVKFLFDWFVSQGCTVFAPLLPGHGTTPMELNQTKWMDWTDCVEKELFALERKCDSIIIGGESMGGVLSLYLAEKYASRISALLLYSTALSIGRLKYAKILKYFSPILDKNLPDDNLPWKGYSVYPLWAADQFYRLTKRVKKNLKFVTSPTIIFQGAYDKTIDSNNIDTIYDQIKSMQKRREIMPNSGHVMLLDLDIEMIKKRTQEFLVDLNILSPNAGL